MTLLWLQIFIITSAASLLPGAYISTNGQSDTRTIQMIHAVFRHGDRSPRENYPNDPYKDYKWPGGFGALSKKGSLQHFNLGRKLRTRYRRLLPKDGQYTQSDIMVKSSEFERCVMSAQSLLAGFLPPLKSENILPINWQPVTVFTIPRALDHLMSQLRPCTKYDNLLQELFENVPEDIRKMNEENKDLYEYLTEHAGQNITEFYEIASLYNILHVQNDNKLTLPQWTESVFPDIMLPFHKRLYSILTETLFMRKVKGGAIISEVYRNMINKRENTLSPDRKIFLYSGHDSTVSSVVRALNIESQTSSTPDYAATIVFELHKTQAIKNDLEVKIVFYESSEVAFPKEIAIPGCRSPCSLTKFGEAVRDVIFDDYDEVCENENPIKLPLVGFLQF